MNEITHNNLPQAITQLLDEVGSIKRLLLEKGNEKNEPETEKWLDLNELVKYDPEKRSKATFYGYIHTLAIPFHKRGKKLIFLKTEIDSWLKAGRKKTVSEIEAEASTFIGKQNQSK